MFVDFHIHYIPHNGEVLMISGSAPETGFFMDDEALEMIHLGDGYWHLPVKINAPIFLEYHYFVSENGEIKRREWGDNHLVGLSENTDLCTLYDFWQPEPEMGFLYSSAYTDSLLAINHHCQKMNYDPGHVLLKVQAPFIRKGQSLGLLGSIELLGQWNDKKALKMQSERFPEWCISLKAKDLPESCSYQFVIIDNSTGKAISKEFGEPRRLLTPRCMDKQMLMHSGMVYRFQEAPWKGAGVAIPVFSLRSENSWGCGDFGDLKKMIDWAETTGQQMIQLLPVNDTTLTKTWADSAPYKTISIFALHPIYASIQELPRLRNNAKMMQYEIKRQSLNTLPDIDYEKVLQLKWKYFHDLFRQEKATIFKSKNYQIFFEKNCEWLIPYAAFCYLRIKNRSFDFQKWGEYAIYNPKKIKTLCHPDQDWFNDIAIHYYIQYQLHLQLSAARNYAHKHTIILKGDIPIGISRYSVETWVEPHLFNMDTQIGSPPDAFSKKGQNWGFPGYNWEQMKAENLSWWKRRFQKMADYFDVYRTDHIFGYFRIWELPMDSVDGVLGHFTPAHPLSNEEIHNKGFLFDKKKMTEPYITDALIKLTFGKFSENVKSTYLKKKSGRYQLKKDFNTQQKIKNHFPETKKVQKIREGLFFICNEVLFVEDKNTPNLYYPRISGAKTECYKSLNPDQKEAFDRLYSDFFYTRNTELWRDNATEILSTLIESTKMLACGEDLGMLPSCVPEIMHKLGILNLEIQRMPKSSGRLFENLNSIPYQSVCTTSTHDINPIRAWWTEKPQNTQQYYQQVLWKKGKAPDDCTPEIAEQIVRIHLESPALWAIIPWQDWVSIDGKLRLFDPKAERINDPTNPDQHWKYRMHITLEQLLKENAFNATVKTLIQRSGR
jgi:4-alpha-glucanotransferase